MFSPATCRPVVIVAFLCMGLTAVCLSPADPAPEVRNTLQAAYNQRDAAFAQKNLSGATALLAPDYVSMSLNGDKTTMAQTRDSDRELFRKAKSVQITTAVQSVTPTPAGATATVKQHVDLLFEYRVLFVKNRARVVSDNTVRDLWVQTAQGWRLKQSQTLSLTTTLNGKPTHG